MGTIQKWKNDNLIFSVVNILISWLDKFPNATLLLGGDFNNTLDGNG